LGAETIALVVTDVVMPGMSGRDLVDELSAIRPGISVLYISGYTDEAIVEHVVLGTDAHFVQKPFTPQQLAFAVRKALDSRTV
jgi:FixJ family two-component response regulator